MTDPTNIHAPDPDADTPRPHWPLRAKVRGWLELVRLPMLLTAPGDSITGALATCLFWAINNRAGCYTHDIAPTLTADAFWPLAVISLLFYAGGLVLNDVADAARDARERPDRPIPSGRVLKDHAVITLSICFGGAMFLAWHTLPFLAFRFAGGLLLCILLYDLLKEKSAVLACILMGLCRAGNFLLGVVAIAAGNGEIAKHPAIEHSAGDIARLILQPELMIPTGIIFLYVALLSLAARREADSDMPNPKPWTEAVLCLLPIFPAVCLLASAWSFSLLLIVIGGMDTAPHSALPAGIATVFFLLTLYGCIKLHNTTSRNQLPPLIGLLLRNIILIQALLCIDGPIWLMPSLLGAWVLHWLLCRTFYAS